MCLALLEMKQNGEDCLGVCSAEHSRVKNHLPLQDLGRALCQQSSLPETHCRRLHCAKSIYGLST